MQMLLGSTDQVAAPVGDAFGLSGTEVSPRQRLIGLTFGNIARATWLIAANDVGSQSVVKGEVQSAGYNQGDTPVFASIDTVTDWVIPHDFSNTYYVRATLVSGDAPSSGSGLGTWLSLVPGGANRNWGWSQTAVGSVDGKLKLEISDDSGGSNIVATGYYRGLAIIT